LIRYRRYGSELLLFELVNATTAQVQTEISTVVVSTNGGKQKSMVSYKTATELLEQSSPHLRDRFEALKAFLIALGDDVQLKTLKYYFAFRRIKNFACVEVHPQSMRLLLYVKIDPSTIQLEKGFTRDVHNIGHYGTGDLEIIIQSDEDLERAKPLVLKSYEVN
jgi:predicted transport protein